MKIGPVYFERPGNAKPSANLKARSMFRWLSAHTGTKVWVIGTSRWSLLILKDNTNASRMTAEEALEAILREDGITTGQCPECRSFQWHQTGCRYGFVERKA